MAVRPASQASRQRHDPYLRAMGITSWRRRDAVDPAPLEPAPLKPAIQADPALSRSSPTVDPGHASALEQLSVVVAGCTRCELHRTRTHTVFGVGEAGARCMIIGEAPGAEEDRRGEPFVGRAGQLLNAMLRAIDLSRSEVYIANIVKCRPPKNRDPRPEEVACCAQYLRRQIEWVAPTVIVAAGRVAAQNLLGSSQPVGRLRGARHCDAQSGLPVIVTYHPAYLLRSPHEKVKVWEDLKRVRTELERAQ